MSPKPSARAKAAMYVSPAPTMMLAAMASVWTSARSRRRTAACEPSGARRPRAPIPAKRASSSESRAMRARGRNDTRLSLSTAARYRGGSAGGRMEATEVTPVKLLLARGVAGQAARVRGWLRTARHSKGVSFLDVSDGSCLAGVQVVCEPGLANFESEVRRLDTGCAVEAEGTLQESRG